MKKFFFAAALSAAICMSLSKPAAAQQNAHVQFVKGNISDKISAVKSSGDGELAKKAVDFVIENSKLLKNDRDLAALAVAGILSYPAQEHQNDPAAVYNDFSAVFYGLDDMNVRVSVLDKARSLFAQKPYAQWTAFVNNYLSQKISSGGAADESVKKSISALGDIGDGSSFAVLYAILRQNIWTDLQPAANDSMSKIADKSLNEIFDAADKAELVELKQLSSIFVKNDKLSAALRSEIAEKLLNRSMILSGNSSSSQDLAIFQLEEAKVLAENKWTRAGSLAKDYFAVAKSAYNGKFLTSEQFSQAISCVELLASRQAVAPLSEYLDQMNKAQEAGNSPDKAVVLAVINALANLGDKSSFDCLLYVTYVKDYPEEVAVAARNALTRLKW